MYYSRIPILMGRPTIRRAGKYEDYKSKYLDLYDRIKQEAAKAKTIDFRWIDFELELIHRDVINVAYIT